MMTESYVLIYACTAEKMDDRLPPEGFFRSFFFTFLCYVSGEMLRPVMFLKTIVKMNIHV